MLSADVVFAAIISVCIGASFCAGIFCLTGGLPPALSDGDSGHSQKIFWAKVSSAVFFFLITGILGFMAYLFAPLDLLLYDLAITAVNTISCYLIARFAVRLGRSVKEEDDDAEDDGEENIF